MTDLWHKWLGVLAGGLYLCGTLVVVALVGAPGLQGAAVGLPLGVTLGVLTYRVLENT